jgi:general L-amino acid transport system permease protein
VTSDIGLEPVARPVRARDRRWAYAVQQALAFAVLGGLVVLMFHVTSANLQARGVHSGFAFLWEPAKTPVSDAPIAVQAGIDSYAKAFAAGALNSLKLAAATLLGATVVGLAVGLGRLSSNGLARALCAGYVEVMRNVPVLLHVFFWYGLLLALPTAAQAASPGNLLLASNRGIYLAWPALDASGRWTLLRPAIDGFEVTAGLSLTPEFAALFIGISLYSAAFVAEIVRAAIGSLPRGQWDATAALGLTRRTTLWRVVFPQALRVAVPPLTSEYLGIFKNSTLAVAIGYQDFMAVSTTMLTDTGQAVEVMAIVMAFYAAVSLLVSGAMHAFGGRDVRWSL